jgi:hypothetical protein
VQPGLDGQRAAGDQRQRGIDLDVALERAEQRDQLRGGGGRQPRIDDRLALADALDLDVQLPARWAARDQRVDRGLLGDRRALAEDRDRAPARPGADRLGGQRDDQREQALDQLVAGLRTGGAARVIVEPARGDRAAVVERDRAA